MSKLLVSIALGLGLASTPFLFAGNGAPAAKEGCQCGVCKCPDCNGAVCTCDPCECEDCGCGK